MPAFLPLMVLIALPPAALLGWAAWRLAARVRRGERAHWILFALLFLCGGLLAFAWLGVLLVTGALGRRAASVGDLVLDGGMALALFIGIPLACLLTRLRRR